MESPKLRPADPESAEARELVRAMEAEIDRLYADREGSIHTVPAQLGQMRPPSGAFVLVVEEGAALGCGGLKRLDPDTGEIKRMYLRPEVRGRGLSALLLEGLESQATALGYSRVRLDTGDRQAAAKHLYVSRGYREIGDYNGNPYARHWFEKDLAAGPADGQPSR